MSKLSDMDLKGLLSSEMETKKYDIDLACQTIELVTDLKNKIKEDFTAIDAIQEKLAGISEIKFVLDNLSAIKESLKMAEGQVDSLVAKLTPKA